MSAELILMDYDMTPDASDKMIADSILRKMYATLTAARYQHAMHASRAHG